MLRRFDRHGTRRIPFLSAMSMLGGYAVSDWQAEAARHGLTKAEIDRMASAFEHQDLEMARNP